MQWNVVIIGSGNVATVLGRKIKNSGHTILQVAGRHLQPVELLASELRSNYTVGFNKIISGADIYIIAVSDDALIQVNNWLPLKEFLVVHTAGSVAADALKDIAEHYGTLYPFQSLKASRSSIPEIPLLINANNEFARNKLADFARSLSDKVQMVDDATRTRLHIAAVITNNFSNHLFTLAQDFCTKEGLDFSLLHPLLEETVNRLAQYQPADMQTGPAIRGDEVVIKNHLSLIQQYPYLTNVYEQMTKSIQNWYRTTTEIKP